MTTLMKERYINSFFVEGYAIKRIYLYNENGIVFSTHSGWFTGSGGDNRFENGLEIPEVKRRLKVNLTKKECFFTPVKGDWYEKGKYAELYLYIDGVDIKLINKNSISKNMSPSEIWDYDVYDIEIKGINIRETTIKEIRKTSFGLEVEKLTEDLKNLGIKLLKYEVELLLKNYTINKKIKGEL